MKFKKLKNVITSNLITLTILDKGGNPRLIQSYTNKIYLPTKYDEYKVLSIEGKESVLDVTLRSTVECNKKYIKIKKGKLKNE